MLHRISSCVHNGRVTRWDIDLGFSCEGKWNVQVIFQSEGSATPGTFEFVADVQSRMLESL